MKTEFILLLASICIITANHSIAPIKLKKTVGGKILVPLPMGAVDYRMKEENICDVMQNFEFNEDSITKEARMSLNKIIEEQQKDALKCPESLSSSLITAASQGLPWACSRLVKLGANVNEQTPVFKLTPLMMIARKCTLKPTAPSTVALLLYLGADPEIKNAKGQTAYEMVQELRRSVGTALPDFAEASCSLVEVLLSGVLSVQPTN